VNIEIHDAPLRPESKNSFRRPAPPASRKSCSACWRPGKNRIVGFWRTGNINAKIRRGIEQLDRAKESRKINWMLHLANLKSRT